MTDSDSAPPAGGLTPKALKLQHSINNWSLLSPKQRTRSVCFMESSLFYYEFGESLFSCSRAEKVTLNEFSWERTPSTKPGSAEARGAGIPTCFAVSELGLCAFKQHLDS